jgi:hypothetical protein
MPSIRQRRNHVASFTSLYVVFSLYYYMLTSSQIKSWATDKVAVRVKDMAQEWYDEHNLNKQDLDAPTSLTAFFSLLVCLYYGRPIVLLIMHQRRVKRDAVNAEGASFWTSIDEVLAARVKEFGSNRSVFTSGWTR